VNPRSLLRSPGAIDDSNDGFRMEVVVFHWDK